MRLIYLLIFLQLLSGVTPAQQQNNVQSILETVDVNSKKRDSVFYSPTHFEAPNWSKDGNFFIVNSRGSLFRIALRNPLLVKINTDFADRCNNDHGISADGKFIAISHSNQNDTSQKQDWKRSTIYVLPIEGGVPRQVTSKTPSFWHGWSPDMKTHAYCAERNGNFDVYTISNDGGEEKRLTTVPGLDDGPEYSHDGKYIYFNSYRNSGMQIWRMNADGTNQVQLTNDQYSNWFPHPSPDGKWLVYISYMQDQKEAHPFGKDVKLKLLNLKDNSVTDLTEVFFGGQGTINVPSWSPDSRKIAFVRYRMQEQSSGK